MAAGRFSADATSGTLCRLVVFAVNPDAGVAAVRREPALSAGSVLGGWGLAVLGLLGGMAIAGLAAAVRERIRPATIPTPTAKRPRKKPAAPAA